MDRENEFLSELIAEVGRRRRRQWRVFSVVVLGEVLFAALVGWLQLELGTLARVLRLSSDLPEPWIATTLLILLIVGAPFFLCILAIFAPELAAFGKTARCPKCGGRNQPEGLLNRTCCEVCGESLFSPPATVGREASPKLWSALAGMSWILMLFAISLSDTRQEFAFSCGVILLVEALVLLLILAVGLYFRDHPLIRRRREKRE